VLETVTSAVSVEASAGAAVASTRADNAELSITSRMSFWRIEHSPSTSTGKDTDSPAVAHAQGPVNACIVRAIYGSAPLILAILRPHGTRDASMEPAGSRRTPVQLPKSSAPPARYSPRSVAGGEPRSCTGTHSHPTGTDIKEQTEHLRWSEQEQLIREWWSGQDRPVDLPLFRMKDDRPGQAMRVHRPCSGSSSRR
jgi:hypothetical protein